jgi:hypothetical protein
MSATQTASEASDIRMILDVEAIKQLKARYIRLVDGKQWDEWATLFTEDCRLETEGGVQEGRDNAVRAISTSLKEGTTIHRATMPEITITGPDTASGIWAMQDVVSLVHNGQPFNFRGYGYYHETYVRTPDGWRMKSSKLVRQRVDKE